MLCSNNCGFYSNANSEGLCSMCYKNMLKKMQESDTPTDKSPVQIVSNASQSNRNLNKEDASTNLSATNTTNKNETSHLAIKMSSEKFESIPNILVNPEKKCSLETNTAGTESSAVEDNINCLTPLSQSSLNSSPESGEGKKPKRRCLECKKKVGLTGFTCRCGGMFCSIHRYSDKHNCSHDYKSPGAEEIRKSNPTVVAEKVKKI